MNRLKQAMKINAAFDHLYATHTDVTEILQFNVIYDALLEIDELIDAAESEQLDEEVELELTPAGVQALSHAEYEYLYGKGPITRPFGDPEPTSAFAGAIEDEFSPFSPSVGTFEGTYALADLIGAYKNVIQRAPVAERAYANVPTSVGGYEFNTGKIVSEAFAPCGAD